MSTTAFPEPPPPPPPSPPSTAGPSFDFLKPLTFVFDDPRWVTKVLIGGLFVIAAMFIIGAFFLYGYLARLTRNVIAGMERPLPEWDDLGEYFGEGAKLFVIALIYVLPILILAGIVWIPSVLMTANTDNESIRQLGGMSLTCMWCLIFPVSLALGLWLPGALLMAIVTRNFKAAFEFGHIFNFIRANIGNYILAFVVWLVARFAAGMGVLLFCIGIVFTMFWAFAVAGYAFGQTYRLAKVR